MQVKNKTSFTGFQKHILNKNEYNRVVSNIVLDAIRKNGDDYLMFEDSPGFLKFQGFMQSLGSWKERTIQYLKLKGLELKIPNAMEIMNPETEYFVLSGKDLKKFKRKSKSLITKVKRKFHDKLENQTIKNFGIIENEPKMLLKKYLEYSYYKNEFRKFASDVKDIKIVDWTNKA